jgi:hypothetical protein
MRNHYIYHPQPDDEPIEEETNRMFSDEEVEQLMKEMDEFDRDLKAQRETVKTT